MCSKIVNYLILFVSSTIRTNENFLLGNCIAYNRMIKLNPKYLNKISSRCYESSHISLGTRCSLLPPSFSSASGSSSGNGNSPKRRFSARKISSTLSGRFRSSVSSRRPSFCRNRRDRQTSPSRSRSWTRYRCFQYIFSMRGKPRQAVSNKSNLCG